jgi:hypothetical protein
MTRKEPTGGKHGSCMTHVPHTYTSNGWLCVDDEPGRAESMVTFADQLAGVRALHLEAEALRPVVVMSVKARKAAERIHRLAPGESSQPFEHQPTTRASCLVYHRCDYMPRDDSANADRRTSIRAMYLDSSGRCPACAFTYPNRPTETREAIGTWGTPAYISATSWPLVGPYLAELEAGERPTLPAEAFIPRTDWTPIVPVAHVKVAASPAVKVPKVAPIKATALQKLAADLITTGRANGILTAPDSAGIRRRAAGPLKTATADNAGAGTYCAREYGIGPSGAPDPAPFGQSCAYTIGSGPGARHCTGTADHAGAHDWPETVKARTVKARKTSARHIHRTADGGAVFVGLVCAECGHAPLAQHDGVSIGQESRILSSGISYTGPADGPTVSADAGTFDRVARTMGDSIADRAASFVLEHPMHDLEAVAGSISRADAILEAPRVKSLAEPTRTAGEPIPSAYQVRPEPIRPTLAIVPDARAQDDRPRCARCGQTFRNSGTGAEWHRVNRLDCAAEYRRATA